MRVGLASVFVVPVVAAALAAQQALQFRLATDIVEVHVTARTADGQLAAGLASDDFELFDNGKPVAISVFSGVVQPITIALLLDRSTSIDGQAPKVAAAAEAFISRLLPDDRAAVNTLTFECQRLTSDKAELLSLLRSPMQSDSGSPVWGGLNRTITALSKELGRRAVLMFSDGDDPGLSVTPAVISSPGPCRAWTDARRATFADVSSRAQREGVTIFTVSVDNRFGESKDAVLRAIAIDTGGDRYRLKDDAELAEAFTRIADELHHQYLLGFVPEVFDGKLHELEVRVKRPGVSVHARRSYLAARADAPAPVAIPTPLSPAMVDDALRKGAAGQKLQASCIAGGVFPGEYVETDAYVEVLLEGPMGRVMRAAREAREAGGRLAAEDVPESWLDPIVHLTMRFRAAFALGRARGPSSAQNAPPPSAITSVLMRSQIVAARTLLPIANPASRPGTGPSRSDGRVDVFDLAAFRALPGARVDVIVRSAKGARACTISANGRAAVR